MVTSRLYFTRHRLVVSLYGKVHTTGMTYPEFYFTERYVPCRSFVITFVREPFPGQALTGGQCLRGPTRRLSRAPKFLCSCSVFLVSLYRLRESSR
jgi:hypothetical protein